MEANSRGGSRGESSEYSSQVHALLPCDQTSKQRVWEVLTAVTAACLQKLTFNMTLKQVILVPTPASQSGLLSAEISAWVNGYSPCPVHLAFQVTGWYLCPGSVPTTGRSPARRPPSGPPWRRPESTGGPALVRPPAARSNTGPRLPQPVPSALKWGHSQCVPGRAWGRTESDKASKGLSCQTVWWLLLWRTSAFQTFSGNWPPLCKGISSPSGRTFWGPTAERHPLCQLAYWETIKEKFKMSYLTWPGKREKSNVIL